VTLLVTTSGWAKNCVECRRCLAMRKLSVRRMDCDVTKRKKDLSRFL